jgi:hypothetical protein
MNDNSFKSSLNSSNTQMSQSDSEGIIQFFPQLKCLLGKVITFGTNKTMHFIYFFGVKLYSLMNTLVHRKENDINVR